LNLKFDALLRNIGRQYQGSIPEELYGLAEIPFRAHEIRTSSTQAFFPRFGFSFQLIDGYIYAVYFYGSEAISYANYLNIADFQPYEDPLPGDILFGDNRSLLDEKLGAHNLEVAIGPYLNPPIENPEEHFKEFLNEVKGRKQEVLERWYNCPDDNTIQLRCQFKQNLDYNLFLVSARRYEDQEQSELLSFAGGLSEFAELYLRSQCAPRLDNSLRLFRLFGAMGATYQELFYIREAMLHRPLTKDIEKELMDRVDALKNKSDR
jgi:hypothetical protein